MGRTAVLRSGYKYTELNSQNMLILRALSFASSAFSCAKQLAKDELE